MKLKDYLGVLLEKSKEDRISGYTRQREIDYEKGRNQALSEIGEIDLNELIDEEKIIQIAKDIHGIKYLRDKTDFNIGPSPEWFILAEAGDDEYFFPKIRINKDYCRVVDIYDNYANNELVIELEKKEAK